MPAARKVIITYNADDEEWRCNFENGREATAHYTTWHDDAVGTAAHMAAGGQVVDRTPKRFRQVASDV
jgi:hypothetical protein